MMKLVSISLSVIVMVAVVPLAGPACAQLPSGTWQYHWGDEFAGDTLDANKWKYNARGNLVAQELSTVRVVGTGQPMQLSSGHVQLDFADYQLWKSQFGQTTEKSSDLSSASVPEPRSISALLSYRHCIASAVQARSMVERMIFTVG